MEILRTLRDGLGRDRLRQIHMSKHFSFTCTYLHRNTFYKYSALTNTVHHLSLISVYKLIRKLLSTKCTVTSTLFFSCPIVSYNNPFNCECGSKIRAEQHSHTTMTTHPFNQEQQLSFLQPSQLGQGAPMADGCSLWQRTFRPPATTFQLDHSQMKRGGSMVVYPPPTLAGYNQLQEQVHSN